jgi:recombination protein RecA
LLKKALVVNYNDLRLGQGRDNAKTFLAENKDICDEIEKLVREKAVVEGSPEPEGSFGEDMIDGDE